MLAGFRTCRANQDARICRTTFRTPATQFSATRPLNGCAEEPSVQWLTSVLLYSRQNRIPLQRCRRLGSALPREGLRVLIPPEALRESQGQEPGREDLWRGPGGKPYSTRVPREVLF